MAALELQSSITGKQQSIQAISPNYQSNTHNFFRIFWITKVRTKSIQFAVCNLSYHKKTGPDVDSLLIIARKESVKMSSTREKNCSNFCLNSIKIQKPKFWEKRQ
jgi:hypothetical protein